MTVTIRRAMGLLRLKDISGGFVDDTDWLAAQDTNGAQIAGIASLQAPNIAFQVEFSIMLYNATHMPIPLGATTQLSLQLLEWIGISDVAAALSNVGTTLTFTGPDSLVFPTSLSGTGRYTIRLFNDINLPVGDTLRVYGKVGGG